MARLFATLLAIALPVVAQLQRSKEPQRQQQRESELKEEDTSLTKETEYAFNPLQAAQEMKVGDFYWKKGSHKAAAGRYEEATRWNPMLPDAWRKLGEAREKLKDIKGARAAYKKYLDLAPDGDDAASVKKKLDRLS